MPIRESFHKQIVSDTHVGELNPGDVFKTHDRQHAYFVINDVPSTLLAFGLDRTHHRLVIRLKDGHMFQMARNLPVHLIHDPALTGTWS